MNRRAQIDFLPDGRRLHLHDGPIDIILQAFGEPAQVAEACNAAAGRFSAILDELCAELPTLRTPADKIERLHGVVARRMLEAVLPYAASTFITPMAAVAGAVAEEILHAMTGAADLHRAYVNNGGDIALHLAPGEQFEIGMIELAQNPSLLGTASIAAAGGIRGIATSGWRGRSFSLGIADAVTVLAHSASTADAAATIIANAVDLPGHPAVTRAQACALAPDSDLGSLLVTQDVAELMPDDVDRALQKGLMTAGNLLDRSLIVAAALSLQGEVRLVSHRLINTPQLESFAHA
jgi:ApbE superfamily uncharacterized protein (UPF0280 family)